MEPVFTMQYAEFKVANCLAEKISDASVFIPASAQEKGIDLLLYRHCDGRNTTNTVQVKMSRTYYSKKAADEYPYYLWFNRFDVPKNADWFVLVGIYARLPKEAGSLKGQDWGEIMLAFTNEEMRAFMDEVRQKRNPEKADKMFGFGFDDEEHIVQTRGYATKRDMSAYLLENRLAEIENSFR